MSRQPSPIQIVKDQKQVGNVEYLNCSGSMITKDERCTHGIKSRIAVVKATFSEKTLLTRELDLNIRKKQLKCYIWNISAPCGQNVEFFLS
jgi:hypothetical protein